MDLLKNLTQHRLDERFLKGLLSQQNSGTLYMDNSGQTLYFEQKGCRKVAFGNNTGEQINLLNKILVILIYLWATQVNNKVTVFKKSLILKKVNEELVNKVTLSGNVDGKRVLIYTQSTAISVNIIFHVCWKCD